MSEAVRAESPLVERMTAERKAASPAEAGATLREHAFLGYVNLRGRPDDEAFLEAAGGVIGGSLPLKPNTVVEGSRARVLWLAPNEWLLVTASGDELPVIAALDEALAGRSFAACDVTGYYTAMELSGGHARDVLEKGCTLDLHPRAFAPGQCAQTLLSHAGIVLRPLADDGSAWELIVRRSFADYVFVWIEDAAGEFGLTVSD
jgi:sarcosine oxidase subunit gamma